MDTELILDLNSKIPSALVSAKQGDKNGRRLIVSFTQDGEDYNLPAGTQAAFRLRKPDNTVVYNTTYSTDTNMELDGNQVIIVLTEQALAVPGRGYADVILQNNKFETVSTSPFILDVVSSPDIGSQIISGNEFGYLQNIVEQSDEIVNAARRWAIGDSLSAGSDVSYGTGINQATISYNPSTNVMTISSNGGSDTSTLEPSDECNAFYFSNLAESWACGERNGIAVVSGPGFENNAKYYAEAAASQAIVAQTWAAAASESAGRIAELKVATMEVAPTGADPSLPAVHFQAGSTEDSSDQDYHLSFYFPPGESGLAGPTGPGLSLASENPITYQWLRDASLAVPSDGANWQSTKYTGQGNGTYLWLKYTIHFDNGSDVSFKIGNLANMAGGKTIINNDTQNQIYLTKTVDYDTTLPSSGSEGQLFFVPVVEAAESGSGN